MQKKTVDNWFEENLKSYNEYLEDSGFCNDRRKIKDINLMNSYQHLSTNNVFAAAGRAYKYAVNVEPDLTCNKEDLYTVSNLSGNQKLKYPVALMTMDEAVLAGSTSSGVDKDSDKYINKSFYLYDAREFWTMTPILNNGSNVSVGVIYNNGLLYEVDLSSTMGIRPVISLNKNVYYNGGEGTLRRPYKVTLDKNEASNIVEPEIIACVVDPSYTYSGGPSVGTQVTYSSKVVYTNHYELVDPQQFNVGDDTSTLVGKFFYYGTSTANSYVYYINSVDETTGAVTSYSAVYNGDCVD